ncbi:MAG: hypothetical protein N2444_05010 [Methylocystis sp.]|nr:hypothetical protein [Methylocystis sp.]
MSPWKERGKLYWTAEDGARRPLIAGSGLVGLRSTLWIVGDDLHHLVRLTREGGLTGEGHRIFAGDLPEDFKDRKRLKPDTECLIALPGEPKRLLAFPSGSKKRRMRGSLVTLKPDETVVSTSAIDLSPFLLRLDEMIPDLNIEGGTFLGDRALLMQRGNGKARFNATIEISGETLEAALAGCFDARAFVPRITEIKLPKIDDVRLTFTDATTHEGRVYFSAAAERSDSTVDDGPVAGSAIGWLDGDEAVIVAEIDDIKIEGVTLARAYEKKQTFLAVTDADEAQTPSLMLEAEITRS